MKAAVLVADTNSMPQDWDPLTNMLAEACDGYVVLCAEDVTLPEDQPGSNIERSDELSALKEALVWSQGQPVLFMAADIISPSAQLARYMEYVRAGYDAVVPMIDRQTCQPLFAIYTGACISHINSALLSGKYDIGDLLNGLTIRYVEPAEVAKFGEAAVILSRSG